MPDEPAARGAATLAAILTAGLGLKILSEDSRFDDLLLLPVTRDLGVRCGMKVTRLVKSTTWPTQKSSAVQVAGDGVVHVVERTSGSEPFSRVVVTIEMGNSNTEVKAQMYRAAPRPLLERMCAAAQQGAQDHRSYQKGFQDGFAAGLEAAKKQGVVVVNSTIDIVI